jgi:plastocyanin
LEGSWKQKVTRHFIATPPVTHRLQLRSLLGTIGACAVLLLAGGCGSGASPTSGTSSASSAPAGRTASGGPKASTTPKFASSSASAPIQSGIVQISYRNIAIDPDTLKVKVGSAIRWTSYDSIEHNVTSEGGPMHFASRNFGEGQTFTVNVTEPGVIHYECTIHPTTMNGTIDVVK